jgi:pimeloyl-ACP methyl ester carboxylesterase
MRHRRPIVFVHGISTSSAIWAPQVAAMRLLGHECATVDLPGHGRRAGEHFTLDSALSTIGNAVRAFDIPPLLVGLSLGGYTSLAFAARNPGAVAGVMLSGCSTEIKGKPLSLYRRVSARVVRLFRHRRAAWPLVTDMLHAMQGYSSLADIRRLTVPVWLVNGRWDVLRVGERRTLAARPATRLHVAATPGTT